MTDRGDQNPDRNTSRQVTAVTTSDGRSTPPRPACYGSESSDDDHRVIPSTPSPKRWPRPARSGAAVTGAWDWAPIFVIVAGLVTDSTSTVLGIVIVVVGVVVGVVVKVAMNALVPDEKKTASRTQGSSPEHQRLRT